MAGGATPSDPFLSAVDRYRDVAKWLVGAFGAIGAVIAGTAPFADLDKTPDDRLGFVVTGGAVALLGVAVVLAATVASLVPRTAHGHEVRALHQRWPRRTFVGLGNLETLLADHPGDVLPPGITSLADLDDAIANLRRQATEVAVEANRLAPDDPARPRYERSAEALRSALIDHRRAFQRLLAMARFEKARTRFNLVMVAVLVGGVATAAGLGLTLYGLGEGDEDPPAVEPENADPPQVTISLTRDGADALAGRLGTSCDTSAVQALLIAGSRTEPPWDVVTLPEDGCRTARFVLTTDLGTIG